MTTIVVYMVAEYRASERWSSFILTNVPHVDDGRFRLVSLSSVEFLDDGRLNPHVRSSSEHTRTEDASSSSTRCREEGLSFRV